MTDQKRCYTVGVERDTNGSVCASLYVEPAFDEGMSSDTLAVHWFLADEAAHWTGHDALVAAVAWAREALPGILRAHGTDEAKVADAEIQQGSWSGEFPQVDVSFDDEANAAAAMREKLADAETPGFQAEFDPDEAARAGAFTEDALSEADALDTAIDLPHAQAADTPTFIEAGQTLEVPASITRANARQLFGKQPGESVSEALDRLDRTED